MITRTTVMTAMFGVLGALVLGIATSARAARSTDACSLLSELAARRRAGRVGDGGEYRERRQTLSLAAARFARRDNSGCATADRSGEDVRCCETHDGHEREGHTARGQRRGPRCLLFRWAAATCPCLPKKGDMALRIAVDGKGWSATEIKSKEHTRGGASRQALNEGRGGKLTFLRSKMRVPTHHA